MGRGSDSKLDNTTPGGEFGFPVGATMKARAGCTMSAKMMMGPVIYRVSPKPKFCYSRGDGLPREATMKAMPPATRKIE